MGARQYTNNASSLTASLINAAAVQVSLSTGEGALFPSPSGGNYALCTLEDVSGNLEIVRMTARTGDLCTIVRAQEGTIAQTFASGSRFELRITKGSLDSWIQKDGDTITGTLDMSAGVLAGGRYQNGEVVNSPIRGDTGVTTNQIVVPSGGGAPTIGGQVIYHAGNLTYAVLAALVYPAGCVIQWHGSLGAIPAGWQLCDGTNGTPDMRGKFSIGAGGAFAVGAVGGADTQSTSSAGAHAHTITPTALTISQLPAHTHANPAGARYVDLAGTSDGITGGSQAGHRNDFALATESTGSGDAHTHGIDSQGAHTHTVSTMPPLLASTTSRGCNG